jgi:uncharacterized damage-inducible protein DinB
VNLLDRLLGHNAWTTRRLLLRCAELSGGQLDREFDIDGRSVRALLRHMIGNMEVWTDLMLGRPVRRSESASTSVEELLARHDAACVHFAILARQVEAENRLDELWLDTLDDPPAQKTYGGAILHVLTHDMHHRAQLLLMLAWLGLTDLPEGDLLGWESANT